MTALTARRVASAALWMAIAAAVDAAAETPAAADPGDALFRAGHYGRAIEQWSDAASGGDAYAAWRLGAVYLDGVVTQRDLSLAARWLQVAAAAGQPAAQLDFATLYDRGEGVEQSHAEAARWYRAAAEAGEVASQFNLGSLYEQGQGVERNPGLACAWYALAARQGFGALAETARDRVASKLGAREFEAAMRRARAFEAKYAKRSDSRPDS